MLEEQLTVFVELLDEGTQCWRPAVAERLSEDTYRIIGNVPDGESWRFQPGEVVRCKQQEFSDGTGLTAFESLSVK
jgi:hypothetical protein